LLIAISWPPDREIQPTRPRAAFDSKSTVWENRTVLLGGGMTSF
jgi:hypothetical protein